MKKYLFFLIVITLLLFGGCSQKKEELNFDPECIEKAKSLMPQTLELVFNDNNFNNLDAIELAYFLEHIVWTDKTTAIVDRGFHQKRGSSKDTLYYPFESNSKTDEAWPHTNSITYQDIDGNRFVYYVTLKATNEYKYDEEFNVITKTYDILDEVGVRNFSVEEVRIIDCIYQK